MKIRTFLQAIIKSITSPQYYLDVLNAPFRFSLRFFLVGYFLLALIATFFYVTVDAPKFESIFKGNEKALMANYPADLVLSWDGKELHSSKTTPIQVSYPLGVPHEGLPEVLAYINPAATSSAQVIADSHSNSLLVVTKSSLFVSNSQGDFSQATKTQFQQRLDELSADLDKADPSKQELVAPPVDMGLTLDPIPRQ